MKKNKALFIQGAIKNEESLSRQLKIPIKDNIPMSLLNKIIKAKAGDKITNPTTKGKKTIVVTRLMERRAILARNLKNIKK